MSVRSLMMAAVVALSALTGGPAAAAGKKLVFGVVPKQVHPFYDAVMAGLEEESKAKGVEYQWVAPQVANDPASQVKIIEDLINKGVNGLAIAPVDPGAIESVVAEAVAKKIPVTMFDSDAPSSKRTAYFGTNNQASGGTAADTLAKLIGAKGEIVIITGGLGAINLNERIAGFKERMASKYPGVKIVDIQGTDDDFAKGLNVAEAILRSRPNLAGAFCASATGGPSLAKALAEPDFKARKGALKVVAFDDLEETKQAIQEGFIQATMVQQPKKMGILTIDALIDLNNAKSFKSVDTGVSVVTRDTLNKS